MSKEIKNRTAMISNMLIPNLLASYSTEELRILFTCISKIQMKYETLKKAEIEGIEGYFEGELYTDKYGEYIEEEDKYKVYITMKEFKIYALKQRYTKQEIKSVVKALSIRAEYKEDDEYSYIAIIPKIRYYDSENKFEITFDPDMLEMIVGLLDNFTVIELLEAKQFSSKYQIGVYMKYKQYRSTGKAILGVMEARNYFSCTLDTHLLVDKIKKAVEVVNKELGTDIRVHQEKNNRGATTNIMLIFSKRI